MKPAYKHPNMDKALKKMGLDRDKITEDICTFCGAPASDFKDDLSRKEYSISGFCQKCQDDTFG